VSRVAEALRVEPGESIASEKTRSVFDGEGRVEVETAVFQVSTHGV
jgi:hypothetical protein